MGGVGARTTAAAYFLAADKKNSRTARLESIVGTAFAGFAHSTLGAISTVSAYARPPLIPLWSLVATGYYMTTDHIVKNKSLSGLVGKFKEHYKPVAKKALWWLTIPTYLTTFLPGLWQVPSIAVQGYIFRKYIAPHKKEPKEEKDKTPYPVAAFNVTSKLVRNSVKGFYDAVYAVGASLYKAAPKPAAPTPQPA